MIKTFEEWILIINPKALDELKKDTSFKFCKQNLYKKFGVSQKMLQKIIKHFDYEIIPLTKSRPLTVEEWFNKNYIKGLHLDKDILSGDSKIYSPETCCFVTNTENNNAKNKSKKEIIQKRIENES